MSAFEPFETFGDAEEIAERLHDADPAVRRLAVIALAEAASPDALPHLLAAVADPDASVRLQVATEWTLGFNGIVSNIEYRGSSVKITVIGAGSDDFTVISDDGDYFARPVAVGDTVALSWALEDAVLLGRSSA